MGIPPNRPRRRFGQNFLADPGAARRIVDALAPARDEPVLEIGPGRGALTDCLAERTRRLAVVEIDRDLAEALERRFGSDRIVVFRQDVLHLDWDALAARLAVSQGERLAVIGNLPYNISKPVAMRLVEMRSELSRAVLMFQREVAERLVATPGSKAYGPLTVIAGAAFRIRRMFDLAPRAFRPRPAVHSSVTAWTPRHPDPLEAGLDARLRACVRACFAHRRRTLFNNLRHVLPGGDDAVLERLAAIGIDPGLRAEALGLDAFLRLAAVWPETVAEARFAPPDRSRDRSGTTR